MCLIKMALEHSKHATEDVVASVVGDSLSEPFNDIE